MQEETRGLKTSTLKKGFVSTDPRLLKATDEAWSSNLPRTYFTSDTVYYSYMDNLEELKCEVK